MTEQLELALLMAFVVSVTALLISGMVLLALRLASPRSESNNQDTSTHADEASSAERRKWKA
jgi:hypothetical protein